MRTLIQDEGLFKKLNIVHQLSGVATTTLNNWFFGDTKNPQHHTIAAVVTSLGYEETFAKIKTLELDKELEIAARWLEKQKELVKRPNGHKRARKGKRNG